MIREETIAFSGLPLEAAISRLRARGIEPAVRFTRAPRGKEDEDAPARVLRVEEGGRVILAARFAQAAWKETV